MKKRQPGLVDPSGHEPHENVGLVPVGLDEVRVVGGHRQHADGSRVARKAVG
jgi:hypothetical protein